jgi:hypothetical protein
LFSKKDYSVPSILTVLLVFCTHYFQCKYVVNYRSSISKSILIVPPTTFSIYGSIFPNIISEKFCKLHFPVLFLCNSQMDNKHSHQEPLQHLGETYKLFLNLRSTVWHAAMLGTFCNYSVFRQRNIILNFLIFFIRYNWACSPW